MWPKTKYKFGNKKIEHAGRSFASKLEAALFDHLTLLEKAGEITDLRCQETVYLTNARIIYKPDFSFTDPKTGEKAYAEAKGFETTDWRIKRRLWSYYGPGRLEIWKGTARNLTLHETIEPKLKTEVA